MTYLSDDFHKKCETTIYDILFKSFNIMTHNPFSIRKIINNYYKDVVVIVRNSNIYINIDYVVCNNIAEVMSQINSENTTVISSKEFDWVLLSALKLSGSALVYNIITSKYELAYEFIKYTMNLTQNEYINNMNLLIKLKYLFTYVIGNILIPWNIKLIRHVLNKYSLSNKNVNIIIIAIEYVEVLASDNMKYNVVEKLYNHIVENTNIKQFTTRAVNTVPFVSICSNTGTIDIINALKLMLNNGVTDIFI